MTDWLKSVLPDWLAKAEVLGTVSLVSIVVFVGSLVALPWIVARLPRDYFSRRRRGHQSFLRSRRWQRPARIAKNVVGALLLLAGIAMLLLPGQGIIAIVVALVLLDYPGKRAFERKLVSRPHVLRALNALRRRAGTEPLVLD